MNLSGDEMLDGRFTIKRGQGLSQAIAGELGLSEEDCLKLGSVWTDIVNIAKEENVFTDNSKKYEDDTVLFEGDVFEFKKESFNKIISLVNQKLNKEIEELDVEDSESVNEDQAGGSVESEDLESSDENAELSEDVSITEDKLPSVLLRNTGIITGAMFIKAIKDPKYRKELLPSMKNLTKAQKDAFDEACKKFDETKQARTKVVKNVKSGVKTVKTGKTQLSTVEKAEKELATAQNDLKKAKEKVTKETKLLKENSKYQNVKTKLSEVKKDIAKLEKQKKSNKTKKLSANNEAKLTELKQQRAKLLQEKSSYETNLNNAKTEQKNANKKLKEAQYEQKVTTANKKIEELQENVKAEKEKLTSNPNYKNAKSKLTKINKEIKALENKQNLTTAEKTQLKKLKDSKVKINKKIINFSKSYAKAKLELNSAKAEAKTLEKLSSNPNGTKTKVKSTIKGGKHRIKINLKKLPKAEAQVLKSAMGRTKAAAKVGGKMLKGVGKVAKPVAVVLSAADIYGAYQTGGTKKAVRQTAKLGTAAAGAWAGAKGGAALGAAVGSVFPGAGTVIGGFVGGVVGGIAGWWAGEKLYDAAEKEVLPNETPLGQEEMEGTTELEFNSEGELEQFLQEHPEYIEAIEE